MTALLRLEATNFRSLQKVAVDLGALNVLVGPNGAGKTNLLSVIGFLGDCARKDLPAAVTDAGGFKQLAFRGAAQRHAGVAITAPAIRIKVEAAVTQYAHAEARDEYALSFRCVPYGEQWFLRRQEYFRFKRYQGRGRRITVRGGKIDLEDAKTWQLQLVESSLALSTLPKLRAGQGGEQVAELADLFTSCRVFDVNVERARLPAVSGADSHLQHDAANLAPFLRYLKQSHRERFDLLREDARHFVPGLLDVLITPAGGAERGWQVDLVEAGLRDNTPLGRASFGTVRALALLALLHDPAPPKLTCVEEIDHGLHPHVFDRLVDRMREASAQTQFLIATHSPALVNRLRAEELIVCERDPETGASRIPAIDSKRVRAMEAAAGPGLRLGELWFSGTLGGVP